MSLRAQARRIALGALAVGCLAVPALSDAATPAATNDNYLSSWMIPDAGLIPRFRAVREVTRTVVENTTGTTTQADLFNPDKAGHPLGGGGPEPSTCAGVGYGSTVWYDLHPNEPVGVQLVASGYPSAVAVYEYNARTAQLDRKSVFCRVANAVTNTFTLPEELRKGQAYTVQVGGLRNGAAFFSGSLNLTINLFPDHDSDQVSDGIDKCPFTAGTLGGCPPALHPTAHFNYVTSGSSLRLTGLLVDEIPGGASVRARCAMCGVSQTVRAGAHASSVTLQRFAGVTMHPGSQLNIAVTKGPSHGKGPKPQLYKYGAIGGYLTYTEKAGKLVFSSSRCLEPGSSKPRRSCT